MTNPESITKIQAAERQLRVAIQLFFQSADLVAVRTLASAASSILRDLARHQGITNTLRDNEFIRPERKRELIGELDRASNFFKHADRDPEAVLEFHRDGVQWSLFEAVHLFGRLTQTSVAETLTFSGWFCLKHPYLISDEQIEAALGTADYGSPDDLDLFLEILRHYQSLERSGRWPPWPEANGVLEL